MKNRMFHQLTQTCFSRPASLLLTALLLATGWSSATAASGQTSGSAVTVDVAATPNPNVFPLLLAMSENPSLSVNLIPVSTSGEAATALAAGQADALLSMTYVAAQDVTTGQVPDLELVSVNFWNGFYMMAPRSAHVSDFASLIGHGVLVAGPTSGGKGGGPDLIFQAAVKRAGLSASSFDVCYLPVMQAVPMLMQQQPMNANPACNPDYSEAPAALSLVEPAATGLVMDSMTSTTRSGMIVRAINYQSLFTGYAEWPQDELPHGGISVRGAALASPAGRARVEAFVAAYRAAADQMINATRSPIELMRISKTISAGITRYYGQYGLSIPPAVIAAALATGHLVYRTDLSVNDIHGDLNSFLTEVVGSQPPASFYHAM